LASAISLASRWCSEPFSENHDLGGFILVDRITDATNGAGVLTLCAADRRRSLAGAQHQKSVRAEIKRQKPCVIWFTASRRREVDHRQRAGETTLRVPATPT
jgi:bifunctional enzyme CysN/CysC